MDYGKIYIRLIDRAKQRKNSTTEYYEKHHIIPRCLGGNNTFENITKLTAREHYIAHLCLWKTAKGKERVKLAYAVHAFKRKNKRQNKEYSFRFNSRTYEVARKEMLEHLRKCFSGPNNPNWGGRITNRPDVREKMRRPRRYSPLVGKYKRTEQSRAKQSRSRAGKATGKHNAMANPINRAKVGASKIGKRLHINQLGERRMFYPSSAPPEFHLA